VEIFLSQSSKHIALWLALALVVLVIFSVFNKQSRREPEIIFSEFMGGVERGDIREVVIQGHHIQGKYNNGETFRTFAPDDPELVKSLRNKQLKITAKPQDESPWYMLLINWFPILLLIGVWIFFMRQMQVGGGRVMSFGKSRARLLTENEHRVTFSDVAGVDEAKDDLQEIIAFLKDPQKFTKLGGRIPKGCLLVGAPGTGKTLLARAIAGDTNQIRPDEVVLGRESLRGGAVDDQSFAGISGDDVPFDSVAGRIADLKAVSVRERIVPFRIGADEVV
jgi:cell division protease FtsH